MPAPENDIRRFDLPVSPEARTCSDTPGVPISNRLSEILEHAKRAHGAGNRGEVDTLLQQGIDLTPPISHDRLALNLSASALCIDRGDLAGAEKWILSALDMRTRLPQTPGLSLLIAALTSNLAMVYGDAGKVDLAIAMLGNVRRSLAQDDSPSPQALFATGANLSLLHYNRNELETAASVALDALNEVPTIAAVVDIDLYAQTLSIAAEWFGRQDQFSRCIELWDRHVPSRADWPSSESYFWFGMHCTLSAVLQADLDSAKRIGSKILETEPEGERSNYPHALCELVVAICVWRDGEQEQARAHLSQSLHRISSLGGSFMQTLCSVAEDLMLHLYEQWAEINWGAFILLLNDEASKH